MMFSENIKNELLNLFNPDEFRYEFEIPEKIPKIGRLFIYDYDRYLVIENEELLEQAESEAKRLDAKIIIRKLDADDK